MRLGMHECDKVEDFNVGERREWRRC